MDTRELLLSFINCDLAVVCRKQYSLHCLACTHNADKRVAVNKPKRDHYEPIYSCRPGGRCEG